MDRELRNLYRRAYSGEVSSQIRCANLYKDNIIVPASLSMEIFWLKKAAQYNKDVRARLGILLHKYPTQSINFNKCSEWIFERNTLPHEEDALQYLKSSYTEGSADAGFYLAKIYSNNFSDTVFSADTIQYLEYAAKNNHGGAKFFLGKYLSLTHKDENNIRLATELIFSSAMLNFIPAIYWSGVFWECGYGVPVNLNLSEYCYLQAAEKGFIPAAFKIAVKKLSFGPLKENDILKIETVLLQACKSHYIPALKYMIYAYRFGGIFGLRPIDAERLAADLRDLGDVTLSAAW